jgi:hypothetical protein
VTSLCNQASSFSFLPRTTSLFSPQSTRYSIGHSDHTVHALSRSTPASLLDDMRSSYASRKGLKCKLTQERTDPHEEDQPSELNESSTIPMPLSPHNFCKSYSTTISQRRRWKVGCPRRKRQIKVSLALPSNDPNYIAMSFFPLFYELSTIQIGIYEFRHESGFHSL